MRTLRVAAVAVALATLVTLAPPGNVLAQDGPAPDWNNVTDPLKGGAGLHYGRIAGHGLSFRVPLRWFLYLQPTGGIWHTSERERHDLGVGLHYILRQDQLLRFYLGGGVAYFYDRELVDKANEVWEKDTEWNYGAGVGVERLLGRRWSLQVEADFIHYGNSGDIKVTPQFGIYYYW